MKTIKKVFLIIGTLVAALLIWALVFNKGGVLETGFNTATSPVNKTWQQITGDSSATIIPQFNVATGGSSRSQGSLGDTSSNFGK